VTSEPPSAARYRKAFRELPDGLWQVFQKPDSLKLNPKPPDKDTPGNR
jgi:hypothetical protein